MRLLIANILFSVTLFFIMDLCCLAEQDTTRHRFAGVNIQYGFILPHSVVIEPVSHSNPYGVLFEIGSLSKSYNSWAVFNTFWTAGLQAGYYSFDNPDTLGGAIVLTGFAEPVLLSRKRFVMSVRAGGGVSYHTKIYDANANPANQFFCTRISFPIYVSLRFKYRISPNIYLTLSGFYNHISNGGVKQPNYGMNFPTVALGFDYYSPPLSQGPFYLTDTKVKGSGFFLMAGILSAYKVVDPTEVYPEKGTVSYGFYARGMKMLKTWYSVNAGAEMIADNAIKETIRREGSGLDYKRVAITVGQDFHFGKVIFTQYMGFYVYCPYKAKNTVYQKYELFYRFSRNISAGFFMKAHTSDAELMGVAFNYYFYPGSFLVKR